MASIGNSLKVSGAVSGATNVNATLYTAPATGYAIIHVTITEAIGELSSVTINGNPLGPTSAGGIGVYGPYYVGPSQAVAWVGGSANGACKIWGVEFTNS